LQERLLYRYRLGNVLNQEMKNGPAIKTAGRLKSFDAFAIANRLSADLAGFEGRPTAERLQTPKT
jgi:hypothetical protein